MRRELVGAALADREKQVAPTRQPTLEAAQPQRRHRPEVIVEHVPVERVRHDGHALGGRCSTPQRASLAGVRVDHVWLEGADQQPQPTPRPQIGPRIDGAAHLGELQPPATRTLSGRRRDSVFRW